MVTSGDVAICRGAGLFKPANPRKIKGSGGKGGSGEITSGHGSTRKVSRRGRSLPDPARDVRAHDPLTKVPPAGMMSAGGFAVSAGYRYATPTVSRMLAYTRCSPVEMARRTPSLQHSS